MTVLELWDLLNGDREPLRRTHPRGKALSPGEYHTVVEIWTVNGRGELLVTLRDAEKDTYPGLWENTGGSPIAGESSRQAAVRELREETGITAKPEELTLLCTYRGRSAFHDLYILRRDIPADRLTLQPGETADARWVTPVELEAMIGARTVARPVGDRYGEVRSQILAFIKQSASRTL